MTSELMAGAATSVKHTVAFKKANRKPTHAVACKKANQKPSRSKSIPPATEQEESDLEYSYLDSSSCECPIAEYSPDWEFWHSEVLIPEARATFWKIDQLCDVVINAGRAIPAHKAKLGETSEFFCNLFKDLTASSTASLPVEESAKELAPLLNFIYGAGDFCIDHSNVDACLQLADKYDVPGLLAASQRYFRTTSILAVSTLPAWIEFAAEHAHQLPGFVTDCERYAARHMQHIIAHRTGKGDAATDWLEELPPQTTVRIMMLRSRFMGGIALQYRDSIRPGYPDDMAPRPRLMYADDANDEQLADLEYDANMAYTAQDLDVYG